MTLTFTPPAALICSFASSYPSFMSWPVAPDGPVSGMSAPSLNAFGAAVAVAAALVADGAAEAPLVPPPEQAPAMIPASDRIAMTRFMSFSFVPRLFATR